MTDNLTLLRELARIKVMFQQQAVCAAIGIPAPHPHPAKAGTEDQEAGPVSNTFHGEGF